MSAKWKATSCIPDKFISLFSPNTKINAQNGTACDHPSCWTQSHTASNVSFIMAEHQSKLIFAVSTPIFYSKCSSQHVSFLNCIYSSSFVVFSMCFCYYYSFSLKYLILQWNITKLIIITLIFITKENVSFQIHFFKSEIIITFSPKIMPPKIYVL